MYLNNLQTWIFGSILSFFICFIACEQSQELVSSYQTQQEFTIEEEQTVAISNEDDDLHLTLLKISDSRCPADINCIRAGEATVNFKIRDKHNRENELTLYYGEKSDFQPDTTEIAILQKNYRVILNNVLPYPGKEEQTPKKAFFKVEEF